MINVEVVSDNKHWKKKLKKNSTFFNKLVKFFPKKYQFKNKKVSLTLLLSNNKNIKKLNKKFRKKNKPTDILSFPFEKKIDLDKNLYLGDIVISYEFINVPILITSLEFKKKLVKTFIHGFLHLLNYDHIKLKDYKKMISEELKIYKLVYKKIEQFI
jgi:probable rRNA maturation factor|tara:strand:+ start:410 stop:880 length:471 start_codon:yes stop_codon:yes gene_type:complete